jgi:hypothetical protein
VLTGRRRTVDSASRAGFERIGPRKHEPKVRKSTKVQGIGPRKHELFPALVRESTSFWCFRTSLATGINHLRNQRPVGRALNAQKGWAVST